MVLSVLRLLELIATEETIQVVLEFFQEILESEEVSAAFNEQGLVTSLLTVARKAEVETANLSLDVLVLLSSHPTVLRRVLSPSQDCTLWVSVLSWLSSPSSSQDLPTAALLTGNISTSGPACLGLAEKSGELLVTLSVGQDQTVTAKLMSSLRLVSQDSRETCRQLGSNTDLVTGENDWLVVTITCLVNRKVH